MLKASPNDRDAADLLVIGFVTLMGFLLWIGIMLSGPTNSQPTHERGYWCNGHTFSTMAEVRAYIASGDD
jgi:hypothetical protein